MLPEFTLVYVIAYILSAPINLVILSLLSRSFKVKKSAWKIAVPLAVLGVFLELSRTFFESESLRVILSVFNFLFYYLAAFILIRSVYGLNLRSSILLWILFSLTAAMMYAVLTIILIVSIL